MCFASLLLDMSQFDYIKDIARFGLENDRDSLMNTLNELVDYGPRYNNYLKSPVNQWITGLFSFQGTK